MPIFQDPDRQCGYDEPRHSSLEQTKDTERLLGKAEHEEPSEEFTRAPNDRDVERLSPVDSMETSSPTLEISDREELMQSIKRGESPTWVLNRTLEDYFSNHRDPPQSRINRNEKTPTPPLLPAAEINEPEKQPSEETEVLASPSEIERPRSALHSGDFREGSPQEQTQQQSSFGYEKQEESHSFGPTGSSPTTPWYTPAEIPPFTRHSKRNEPGRENNPAPVPISPARSRAPSQGSFSSSYVLKVPTSPLVHQANNTDLDFSPKVDLMDLTSSPDNSDRRRTLPPETFRSLQSSPQGPRRGYNSRPTASWRRESTFPYQHHPRRSLTSAYSLQQATSPYSTYSPQPRRPSYSSDLPPLQHAPMVGSYEESILRGRMSTTPSKPLDFTAQIGVLGRGNCKSNLRCPAHVTVPFPAVFYSYPTAGSGRSISDDSPSPYVGLIDIENSLQKEEPSVSRRRRRHTSPFINQENLDEDDGRSQKTLATAQQERRKREKRSRRSQSPKAPAGGCYRIPQQGQLQIIIKNPNKTAVKLFLVPYDLEGMEPGTKTFIRQRSYSAGPIVDIPPATTRSEDPDAPDEVMGDPNDKPILRYLVHINICCPSKGRFYLHSSMRVVFANRVPDGKEKLRNEIHYPEPRYSPYKPAKDAGSSNSTKLASEKVFRRRSSGYGLSSNGLLTLDGINHIHPRHSPLLPSIISRPLRHLQDDNNSSTEAENMEIGNIPMLPSRFSDLPFQDISPCANTPAHGQLPTPGQNLREDVTPGTYSKLGRGDNGYGGYRFGTQSNGSEAGESLLAQRLRSLGVERNQLPPE